MKLTLSVLVNRKNITAGSHEPGLSLGLGVNPAVETSGKRYQKVWPEYISPLTVGFPPPLLTPSDQNKRPSKQELYFKCVGNFMLAGF